MTNQAYLLQLQGEAEQMLGNALVLVKTSYGELVELAGRMELGADHNYEYELPAFALPTDASAQLESAPGAEARAAALFLDAGRRLVRLQESGRGDFNQALACLQGARNFARRVRGPVMREVEQNAAHSIAYLHLTRSGLASGAQKAFHDESAARYAELEGFLALRQGKLDDAAAAYGTARFRYSAAEKHEQAARAAAKEAEHFLAQSKPVRASEALRMRADALFRVADPSGACTLEALRALVQAGRLLVREDAEREQAARILLDAGEQGFAHLDKSPQSADAQFGRTMVEALGEAAALYERMSEFARADRCHYLRSAIRRTRLKRSGRSAYLHPGFLASLLLDKVWGYGTRPWNLALTALGVIVVFAAAYFYGGDVRWKAGPAGAWYGTRFAAAVVLSISALFPAQLVERIAKLNFLPEVVVNRAGDVLVLVETVVGATIIYMAAYLLTRWFKRRFLPATKSD